MKGNTQAFPTIVWHSPPRKRGSEWGAASALAAASQALKGWDDALAKECLDTAIKLWHDEHAHPTVTVYPPNWGFPRLWVGEVVREEEWKATIELLVATQGGEDYKKHLVEMFPTMQNRFGLERLDGRSRAALHGR